MRRIFGILLLIAGSFAPLASVAQQTYPQREFFASDFGQWRVPSQQANTYQWSPGSICQVSAGSTNFFAFATNAPIYILDATAANSEVVTPSAVSTTSTSCSVTISPSNQHFSFSITSATGGLQEALNQISSSNSYPAYVVLDRNWYSLAAAVPGKTPASIIASVAGNVQAILVDRTTAPQTYYSWNGTNYTTSASNQTVPTVAAGGGAGTSPTITVVGNGVTGVVTLTTGTTPSGTATIFTLTWPAIASGGFQYAPSCTITSIGTRAYTGTNAAVAGPPAVDTYTSTSSALTASVSGYKWQYVCR
jgi:hypothetical protein